MGWIYYFNAISTIVLFLFLIATSILAFSKAIANIVIALGAMATVMLIVFGLFMFTMSAKNKKSYLTGARKRLLSKRPYSGEIGNIALILLFAWLQIKCFIAL